MNKFKKIYNLPFKKKLMCIEAFILAGYYRFQILHRPFAKLSIHIGTVGYETSLEENYGKIVYEVREMVEAVCRNTPWESKCLVRALVAKKMLNRKGHPCTLYMGVKLDKEASVLVKLFCNTFP